MKLLITNDDGAGAPGLRVLARTMAVLGHAVVVVSPRQERSGSSRARTARPLEEPYEVRRDSISEENIEVFTLNGSPAACVIVGLTHLLSDGRPDLCLSGVNAGENLGQGLTISGTFGAALEAATQGIPAISISRGGGAGEPSEWDWDGTSNAIKALFTSHLGGLLPRPGQLYNINVPHGASGVTPVRWTRVSAQTYQHDAFDAERGVIRGSLGYEKSRLASADDILAFAELGLISITPLTTRAGGPLSHIRRRQRPSTR